MITFVAAYVTTDKKQEFPLCVEKTKDKCKKRFCEWYNNVDYIDISVRYATVTIAEQGK